MKAGAPIRFWRERIDAETCAAIAFIEFVRYGRYHAATAFAIVGHRNYSWREDAERTLRKHIIEVHHGHVPALGKARDLD